MAERRSEIGRREVLALGGLVLAGCAGQTASPSGRAAADPSSWPTGGTAAMKDRDHYPDPFANEHPSKCAVTCELTEGPCYSAQSEMLRDISYGCDGVPMRLALRVLDESCAPLPGAVVDVWHVSAAGKYSGNDAAHEDVGFCTGNDAAFSSKLYFRGKQKTDANGVVTFDSCFPGWYRSRTVHVHLTISLGGQAFVTTQLCFDDALVDAIIASQEMYGSRGARDTTNATDTVFDAKTFREYQLATARMTDGALLASKTVMLRKATNEPICGDQGGPPMGGPGGPGGGPHGPPPPGMRPPPGAGGPGH